MKVEWEKEDIIGGTRYGRSDIDEVWMICYTDRPIGNPIGYASVSLDDGMVTKLMTKHELAQLLTKEGYVPEVLL